MTALYLCGKPEETYNTIVFDYDKERRREIASIEMAEDSTMCITDFDTDKTEVDSSKLFHAMLEAINHGWFYPNKESIELMAVFLDENYQSDPILCDDDQPILT